MSNFREFMRNQFYTDNDMYDFKTDDEIFESMADFITSLDPEQLTEDQLETVLNILDAIEVEPHMHDVEDDIGEETEIDEVKRLAGRTKIKQRIQSRKYYKRNKSRIKRRKKRFKKSAEGRARARKKKKMERVGRTATGHKQRRYHK